MDQGTRSVDATARDGREPDAAPRATAEMIGNEIAMVRGELDTLLAELDRRRHQVLDIRLQVRRHALGAALTTVALVGTAAGFVWLGAWRQRRRQRFTARASRLRHAVARMVDQPERVAAEPTLASKIVAAAASAAVASLARKLLERGADRLLEHSRAAAEASEPPRVETWPRSTAA